MKNILLSVLLSTGVFAYDNYDVETLYCLALHIDINGQITHLNDYNRKQLGLDGYSRFIKTRSWIHEAGQPNEKSLYSHVETITHHPPQTAVIYTYPKGKSSTTLIKVDQYTYILNIYIADKYKLGGVIYGCTTNP